VAISLFKIILKLSGSMKKLVLTVATFFALSFTAGVMAQDAKTAKQDDKTKTECCKEHKDKKESCCQEKDKKDDKKSCCSDKKDDKKKDSPQSKTEKKKN
jgi:Ni/Co efflux regulator RcnB